MASCEGGPAHKISPSGALASTDKLIAKKAAAPRRLAALSGKIAVRDRNKSLHTKKEVSLANEHGLLRRRPGASAAPSQAQALFALEIAVREKKSQLFFE